MESLNPPQVSSLKQYHEILVRNGWMLPPLKSPFVTLEYLHGVRQQKYYCPRYEDVRLAPCPQPPQRTAILNAIVALLHRHDRPPLGDLTKYMPETQWLLRVLSSLHPNHAFFHKDYTPPPI